MKAEEVILPDTRAFYGMPVAGGGPDLQGNFERFIGRLRREWQAHWPIIIIIDGTRMGAGKSTLGIQICRALDPKFDLSHFAFRGRDLEPLYATLPPWTMVQLDEPRDLLASKGTRDRELMHVVAALGSVRKNLIGTILISPKKEMFDSLVMNGLAPYWIFVEARGIARVHRAWTGATYKKSQRFVPYDRARIEKIGFGSLDRDPLFKAYLELAIAKNRAFFAEGEAGGGRRAAPREATPTLTGPERAMSPTTTEPIKCGRFTFSRRDAWIRHLSSRAHVQMCPRA